MSIGKIKLMDYQTEHIEKQAYDFVMSQPDDWTWKGKDKAYWAEYFLTNTPKIKLWSDYAGYLVSTHPTEWVRENWKKKITTSIKHWSNVGSAVQEKVRDAFLVLSDIKNLDYSEYKEAYIKGIWWDEASFTEISRMPIIKVFKYPQDSSENQVRYYIDRLLEDIKSNDENKRNKAMDEVYANTTLRTLLFGENGTMEKFGAIPKNMEYIGEPWCSQEDLVNILSGDECRMRVLGAENAKQPKRVRESCNYEELVEALENGSRRYFRDDIKNSCSWKRVCIMCLRQDTCGTYMGFSPSFEQRIIRERGISAFSQKLEERQKAMGKYEALKEKVAKEKEKEKEAKN